ncbi:enterobacteria phage lambda, capsid assembly protein [Escherichia coli]|nr:enterobacteria phage lambda, capsid assembly protein [Escherichia coli]
MRRLTDAKNRPACWQKPPGMTVETARRILAAAPQSAQARSDTALDRLMQGAPAPLAAGNPASDAVNDLLNTPV